MYNVNDTNIFQSTLPHGERRASWCTTVPKTNFNPRSRMGSDSESTRVYAVSSEFQSTLPHGERRGATPAGIHHKISIHAPAWGATQAMCAVSIERAYFNPRSRMGSDAFVVHGDPEQPISIHAPAWGATRISPSQGMTTNYFNPRSRMGSDSSDDGQPRR